jgi:hypothetical protein
MEKAFDIGALAEELKGQGLEIAEESAKIMVKAVFNWLESSVKLTPNPYDDFFVMARPQIEAVINPAVEKINPAD